MTPTSRGSLRLFQAWGVTVFVHWSWFLVATYELNDPANRYQSRIWNVVEYLSLFVIVLMHEFGHALACRQVGGRADQIVLWPFGGVAYVNPPQRPGATLWSIAAGPLVNVVLFFLLLGIGIAVPNFDFGNPTNDAHMWLWSISIINIGLLVFNILPIYPLDGGQIVRSLLWFVIGRAKSLLVATSLGLVGVVFLIAIAFWQQSIWGGLLCAFILMNCWAGLRTAITMMKLENMPRRSGVACPSCHAAPQIGAFWVCSHCHQRIDTFETLATCPHCNAQFSQTRCINCGADSPLHAWTVSVAC